MKKLIILTICVAIIGGAFAFNTDSAASSAAIAQCANHNADPTKRYLGGRMINHETRQPMANVRVILINFPWMWRTWRNEDLPLPPKEEHETFTNANGEFWFCGIATREQGWGITPSHSSAYVRPTVIYYFEPNKDLNSGYESMFEMTPF